MDMLDKQILLLLEQNARMTVKELAQQVSLTPPAVSQRIRRMETDGIIEGYTTNINLEQAGRSIRALISLSVPPDRREEFETLMEQQPAVLQCYHVTGAYSFIVSVAAKDMPALERLINRFQKIGQTSTQIILSSTKPTVKLI
ncbi:MAG: Lrp/AsnC family transcriptional regulator [Pygmaiobacter massiliensis]|nr:Lrp/AsnC family transcriptional regulator [Pygmaiobacter massiliensis]